MTIELGKPIAMEEGLRRTRGRQDVRRWHRYHARRLKVCGVLDALRTPHTRVVARTRAQARDKRLTRDLEERIIDVPMARTRIAELKLRGSSSLSFVAFACRPAQRLHTDSTPVYRETAIDRRPDTRW
jgi:hypothetical protein